jgi:integrase
VFLEGGKRTLSKPIIKKDPITPDILNKIIDMYGKDHSNLKNVRLCAMLLLGYAGFLRYSEIANLKMENINLFPSYIVVNIVSGKTDVYRRGNNVVIAKTNGKACPVSWLLRYISLAELRYDSEDFIFRAIRYFKSKNVYKLINVNRSLSYTRARELLINCLTVLGLDSSKFCLHSLRSGDTTAAAANNISDRLIKEHGRWKTDFSKDGYIQDTISNQLSVSANLGI